MNTLSTYPFYAYFTREVEENTTKGETIIEDGVWIGRDALICSGAKVGKGSIVGAGSVVRGKFAPYSIIIGNPAKCIKTRLSREVIEILEDIDLQKLNSDFITQNLDLLYAPLTPQIAQEIALKFSKSDGDSSKSEGAK